jgi:hypothetical protein
MFPLTQDSKDLCCVLKTVSLIVIALVFVFAASKMGLLPFVSGMYNSGSGARFQSVGSSAGFLGSNEAPTFWPEGDAAQVSAALGLGMSGSAEGEDNVSYDNYSYDSANAKWKPAIASFAPSKGLPGPY